MRFSPHYLAKGRPPTCRLLPRRAHWGGHGKASLSCPNLWSRVNRCHLKNINVELANLPVHGWIRYPSNVSITKSVLHYSRLFTLQERRNMSNTFTLTLGPDGAFFNDTVASFQESMHELERGTVMEINGQAALLMPFICVYTGDMPQQADFLVTKLRLVAELATSQSKLVGIRDSGKTGIWAIEIAEYVKSFTYNLSAYSPRKFTSARVIGKQYVWKTQLTHAPNSDLATVVLRTSRGGKIEESRKRKEFFRFNGLQLESSPLETLTSALNMALSRSYDIPHSGPSGSAVQCNTVFPDLLYSFCN